ncbi:MAG: hypothetical protein H7Z38_22335 [Rubrivivax sp.]|nr:hypothetical protein [Pyrinomonadaceae bacterium]
MRRLALLLIIAVLVFSYQAAPSDAGSSVLIQVEPLRMCGAPARPQNDKETNCLRGNVRTVRTEIVTLSKQGNSYVDGYTTQIRTDAYDKRGHRTEQIVQGFNYNNRIHTDSRVVWRFDSEGRASGWEDYADDRPKPPAVSSFSYDGKGNRVKETVTLEDGTVRAVSAFGYDERGRRTEERYENTEGSGGRRVVNTYDGEGNLIGVVSYNDEGALTGKSLYSYDKRGNRVGVENHRADAQGNLLLKQKISHEYDGRGFVVERRYYKADGSLTQRVIYGYDDKANITSLVGYNGDGGFASGSTFEYEYDPQGNWLKCVHLNRKSEAGESEPHFVERRTVIYF